ncbi:hypothetical protein EGR_09541 [Echinococcus granulosus]|uniref:Uncharacterized protein n=1 Tax=Echinococcus granulosus TaxID=6210 RepID=W6U4W2_ECHGR|nr:hypothetical protein EGR_09541 [Echinococcus granulosus]EUB55601.1 hypothetical protein EGR_09541 [Echinococcus granulosus]
MDVLIAALDYIGRYKFNKKSFPIIEICSIQHEACSLMLRKIICPFKEKPKNATYAAKSVAEYTVRSTICAKRPANCYYDTTEMVAVATKRNLAAFLKKDQINCCYENICLFQEKKIACIKIKRLCIFNAVLILSKLILIYLLLIQFDFRLLLMCAFEQVNKCERNIACLLKACAYISLSFCQSSLPQNTLSIGVLLSLSTMQQPLLGQWSFFNTREHQNPNVNFAALCLAEAKTGSLFATDGKFQKWGKNVGILYPLECLQTSKSFGIQFFNIHIFLHSSFLFIKSCNNFGGFVQENQSKSGTKFTQRTNSNSTSNKSNVQKEKLAGILTSMNTNDKLNSFSTEKIAAAMGSKVANKHINARYSSTVLSKLKLLSIPNYKKYSEVYNGKLMCCPKSIMNLQ